MNTFFSILPILTLLVCLIGLKMNSRKAGALSILIAIAVSVVLFKVPFDGLVISTAKGFSLSLYVLLIIWAAIFLYNVVNEVGALKIINKNISIIIKNEFIQFLLISWLFSAFLQGIAGFGVPVAVVVPILIGLGFDPVKSVAAALIGHSWSISFGSMGSSFFAINLVTNVASADIGYWMAVFDTVSMFLTGIAVCYIYGGFKTVRKGILYVLPTSILMATVMFTVVSFELMSMIALITASSGMIFLYTMYRLTHRNLEKINLYSEKLTLFQSLLPYGLIVVLSIFFQITKPNLFLAFDFPGYVTMIGNTVNPVENYAKIKLLKHPAPIMALSILISVVMYNKKKIWSGELLKTIAKNTANKCMGTTITLGFLIPMAVIMMDSGMIRTMAESVAKATGEFYPLFAPFIGVLGAFITGSNTNSNVIFGNFQETVAMTLGVNTATMCGLQSISASAGCSIAPTTVLLGTTAGKINGQEHVIYRKLMGISLGVAGVLGIFNYIILKGFIF